MGDQAERGKPSRRLEWLKVMAVFADVASRIILELLHR